MRPIHKNPLRPGHAKRQVGITHYIAAHAVSGVRYGAEWFSNDQAIASDMLAWIHSEKTFMDPDLDGVDAYDPANPQEIV